MPAFLEQFSGPRRKKNKAGKKLSDASTEKGSPHTLVVAGAGLRAADVTRALRKFQTKEAMVAKLFAKHIKLKEAIEMVKTTRMGIGVGTPQRLIDLLDDGEFKIEVSQPPRTAADSISQAPFLVRVSNALSSIHLTLIRKSEEFWT